MACEWLLRLANGPIVLVLDILQVLDREASSVACGEVFGRLLQQLLAVSAILPALGSIGWRRPDLGESESSQDTTISPFQKELKPLKSHQT
jgi:hypothetical protein